MKRILFIPAILFAFQLSAQKIFLHCGKLIDGIGNKMQVNKTIVVEKNKILEIKDGYLPAG